MVKEELEREQAEMEREAEETTSRNGEESKIVAVSAGEASNGVSETNGHAVRLEISQNGAGNEEQMIEETEEVLENESEAVNVEEKTEEESRKILENGTEKKDDSDGVLENKLEFINGEHEIEESKGVLENKLEFINGEQEIEESNGVLENGLEFINGEPEIEESNEVLENGLEFINGGHEIEESNGVLENESEIVNGEHELEKDYGVVFFEGKSNGVLENELEFINGEQKVDKSNGVLENGSEFTNGEEKIDDCHTFLEIPDATNRELKLESLVFHDKDEGLWKCRICTWTHGNGSVSVELIQNHRGQLHNLMNIKTLNFESEGVKSTSTYIVEEQILKGPEPVKVDASEIKDTHVEEIEENGISSSNHEHSDSSFEEGGTSHYEPSKEIESAEADLINEDDLDITEFQVERVIKKQTTHDLYCPNCKSCITKRVILRKRKRGVRIPDEDVKRNKTGTTVGPKLGSVSTPSPEGDIYEEGEGGVIDSQEPTIDEDRRDREPDIFRCLSCFSIFIPTGDGFKLFKKNWFTNIFAPNKHVTVVARGSSSTTTVKHFYTAIPSSDTANQSSLPSVLKDTASSSHFSEGLEGNAGINITQEGRDTSPSLLNLNPSVNGDMKATDAGGLEATNGLTFPNLTPFLKWKASTDVGGKLDQNATEAADLPTRVSEGLEGTTGLNAAQENGNKTLDFPNLIPFVKWKPATGVGGKLDMVEAEAVDATIQKFDVFTADQLKEPKAVQEHDGLKLLITSNKGSPILEKIDEGNKPNQTVQTRDKDTIQLSPPSAAVIHASDVDGKLNISLSIPHEEQDVTATIVTKSVLENNNVDSRGNDRDEVYPPEVAQQIITETKIEVHPNEPIRTEISSALLLDAPVAQDNDTVITIDRQPPALLPAAASTATASQSETPVSTADRDDRKIEVVKSIVYGGLAESITSLSVVSSAAGGGAATLNVLALGAANLIGGLLVISHNLWDLRCDREEQQVSNQVTEQKDRYRELLGRRQNFVLHAVVAIISYLIFGLVSPVVYGFSFRGSDDKQMKVVVTAAASLVCILILAVAKAYVQRPPKPYLKTVFTFMILGFMVSGVSYAAGELVGRLLEKLGLFEAGSPAPNLLVQEMIPVGSGWASY